MNRVFFKHRLDFFCLHVQRPRKSHEVSCVQRITVLLVCVSHDISRRLCRISDLIKHTRDACRGTVPYLGDIFFAPLSGVLFYMSSPVLHLLTAWCVTCCIHVTSVHGYREINNYVTWLTPQTFDLHGKVVSGCRKFIISGVTSPTAGSCANLCMRSDSCQVFVPQTGHCLLCVPHRLEMGVSGTFHRYVCLCVSVSVCLCIILYA